MSQQRTALEILKMVMSDVVLEENDLNKRQELLLQAFEEIYKKITEIERVAEIQGFEARSQKILESYVNFRNREGLFSSIEANLFEESSPQNTNDFFEKIIAPLTISERRECPEK